MKVFGKSFVIIAFVIALGTLLGCSTKEVQQEKQSTIVESPTTVVSAEGESSVPSVVSKEQSQASKPSSNPSSKSDVVSSQDNNKNKYKKEYEKWLFQQREGFELLLHAPKNHKTLTREQIEQIFYVDLPEKYTIKDYTCRVETDETDRPGYSFTLIMDEQGLSQMLESPKMKDYHKGEIKYINDYIIKKNKVERFYEKGEDLLYHTETGLTQCKCVDMLQIYILKEKVDENYQVYFYF